MRHKRKAFEPGSTFPFDYVHHDRKHWEHELPDHLHDWHELVYIYSGRGTFFVDQTLYDMKQGDLFVIPGNTIHRSFPDQHDPVTTTAIYFAASLIPTIPLLDSFSPLYSLEHAKEHKSYKIELDQRAQTGIEHLLEQLQQEKIGELPGYRQAILLQLHHILLLANRLAWTSSQGNHGHNRLIGPAWMHKTLSHIDQNLNASLRLSSLANLASVTPAHFSRVFKQLTGMTVTEYVTTKRIIAAQELLLSVDSDISIQQIAEQCGFESLPHFHRMFKAIVGTTPAAYRSKNARNNHNS